MSNKTIFKYVGRIKITDDNGVGRDHFVYRNKAGTVEVYITKQAGGGWSAGESNLDERVYHSIEGTSQNDRYNIANYTKELVETTIKEDERITKELSNTGWGGFEIPNFLSSSDVSGGSYLDMTQDIKEQFATVKSDYFFTDKFFENNSAQYPYDAIYDKKYPDSQDHLVISQYSYKAPRADDIWGKDSGVGIVDLLTKGIGRNSPLDKFLGLVRLPMPNSITDSNNVRWGEDSLNAIEAAALKAVGESPMDEIQTALAGAVTGTATGVGPGEGAQAAVALKVLNQLLGQLDKGDKKVGSTVLGTEATARILAAMGIETSAEAILARRDGVVPNSNLELLFQAPMLRQFSFMYKMSPRSAKEAKVVNAILRFFKQGMAAKKKNAAVGGANGARSYFLGTPNVFRLQYRTSKDEAIKGLNRIKTCALTGTSVNYTPEGAFAAYDGGQPVSVLLTLGFQELEPIYDIDYKTGENGTVEDERTSDTDTNYRWRIKKDEVGY